MERRIPESDWKTWRRLHAVALERFCQKILREAVKFEGGEGTAHERYIKLYQLLKKRDKKLGEIFDGPKRSDAYFKIAAAVHARVVTKEELAELTEDTQNVIAFLSGETS